MKTKLKKLVRSAKCLVLSAALCAVGLSAWAEPDAVQLWKDGPYFATCNVGADTPEGYGILTNFNDAAQAVTDALGSDWHLPSEEELKMLAGKNDGDKVCSNVWTTCNGVAGCRFFGMTSGYEDKSIFLPAAGVDHDNGDGREAVGSEGYYWSSKEGDGGTACLLYFYDGYAAVYFDNRSNGMSVRAVRDTTPTPPEPSDEEVVATAEATFVLGPALAVANVKTATHWPWDGKIDVTCDLTGMGNVQLSAALTTNGVTVCTAKAENLTGETTINLDAAGGVTNGVKFVWNAKADCPASFNSTDTKVKVTAKKAPPPPGQLWEGGPIWAETNLGDAEQGAPAEYGALYKFDDAAKAVTEALGEGWRVPTEEELKKLAGENTGDKVCSNVWTTCNGVAGRRFFGMTSGYEDKSIFLPAACVDQGDGNGRKYAGGEGYYWSSTEENIDYARALDFDQTDFYWFNGDRSQGFSVRAVRDAK